jgi:hypothetical protein
MFHMTTMERRERIALRNAVDKRSWDFDWSKLGMAYHRAHDLSIERLWMDIGTYTPQLHLDIEPKGLSSASSIDPTIEARSTDDL